MRNNSHNYQENAKTKTKISNKRSENIDIPRNLYFYQTRY